MSIHQNHIINLDGCKSYATKERMLKEAEKLLTPYVDEYADQAIIVPTEDGRWTAIFKLDMSKGGYLCRYSIKGFMSI